MRETAARPGGRCGVGGRRKGQTAGSRRQAAGATPWPLLVRRLDVQQLLLHWHSPTRRSPCCSAGLLHLPCCPHVRTAPGRERPSRARREQRRATSRYRGSTPSAQQPTLGVAPGAVVRPLNLRFSAILEHVLDAQKKNSYRARATRGLSPSPMCTGAGRRRCTRFLRQTFTRAGCSL